MHCDKVTCKPNNAKSSTRHGSSPDLYLTIAKATDVLKDGKNKHPAEKIEMVMNTKKKPSWAVRGHKGLS